MKAILVQDKGFTIIEIIIAAFLLCFGILAVESMFSIGSKSIFHGKAITTANNLARDKIEELMHLPYQDPMLSVGVHQDVNNPLNAIYYRQWEILIDTPSAGLKQVTVTVNWEDRGESRSLELVTLIAENG